MKRIQGKRAKKQSVQKSSIDSSQCCQPSVCSAKLKQCAISHAIRTAAKDLRRCIGGVKKPKRQVCCAHHKKRKFCMLWGNSKTGSTWYTNGEIILRFCYCKMPKCIPITVGWETCSKQLPLRLDVVVFCDKKKQPKSITKIIKLIPISVNHTGQTAKPGAPVVSGLCRVCMVWMALHHTWRRFCCCLATFHLPKLTSQCLPVVMVVTFQALAAPLLHQRRAVFATVLRFLLDDASARHHTVAAGRVTFAPLAPFTDDAVDHWK